jgi:5-methylcytosine-specific restriction endonuclease McrA
MNYKDKRWLHKREVILRRDQYLCRESKRYGKTKGATTVHHIYPVEFYPELAYEDWNLISLSDSRHNTMHDRDTHQITEIGKRWQEKVKDKFIKWYTDRNMTPPHWTN